MSRRDGRPLWIEETTSLTGVVDKTEVTAHVLERVKFHVTSVDRGYDEAWLQDLLDRNPAILPVQQIESEFRQLISVCRELPLIFGGGRTGSLDNLFVTPTGGLVIVETKLWNNPEAKRAAVAQVMEYAAAVFRLNYEGLQSAILSARKSTKAEEFTSLLAIVEQQKHVIDEAEFIDAVTRNLKKGRAIVAIVGDGIQEDLMSLAELLQSHAGLRFTFAQGCSTLIKLPCMPGYDRG